MRFVRLENGKNESITRVYGGGKKGEVVKAEPKKKTPEAKKDSK